jgi:hypothetical protein
MAGKRLKSWRMAGESQKEEEEGGFALRKKPGNKSRRWHCKDGNIIYKLKMRLRRRGEEVNNKIQKKGAFSHRSCTCIIRQQREWLYIWQQIIPALLRLCIKRREREREKIGANIEPGERRRNWRMIFFLPFARLFKWGRTHTHREKKKKREGKRALIDANQDKALLSAPSFPGEAPRDRISLSFIYHINTHTHAFALPALFCTSSDFFFSFIFRLESLLPFACLLVAPFFVLVLLLLLPICLC